MVVPARTTRLPLFGPLVLALVLLAAALAAGTGLPTRPAASISAGASTSHPFSNPVWWPVDVASNMGCYRGNPTLNVLKGQETCRTNADGTPDIQHKVWALDIPSQTRQVADPHEGVYAAGAGIVHVGGSGWTCRTTSTNSRGNWLWIDHGNGVVSEYGHLGSFQVRDGQYVSARTQIATIGNSGYSRCATVRDMRYLWFGVRYGGRAGAYVDFKTLKVCSGGSVRTWPSQLPNSRWTVFNELPSRTALPATSGRGCIPAPPATPSKPGGGRVSSPAAGRLSASWSLASSTTPSVIVVQLQEWHPTISQWLDWSHHRKSGTSRTTLFTGLQSHRHYRMRVWFGNGTGWSAASAWSDMIVR
jgi:Peptidase family M23